MCLVIPNKVFKSEWMKRLEAEGCKVYMNGFDGEIYAFVRLPTDKALSKANETNTPSKDNLGRPWTQEEYEKLKELRSQGFSLKEIAAKLNRTKSSIIHKLYDKQFQTESMETDKQQPTNNKEAANETTMPVSNDNVVKEFLTCVSELYPRYPQVCKFLLREASNRILEGCNEKDKLKSEEAQ